VAGNGIPANTLGAPSLAVDARNLAPLGRRAAERAPDAIDAAAAQFEALFIGMVLDGMRRTTFEDGGGESSDMQMFHQMFDRQVAQEIGGGRGLGLARLLAEQLRRMPGVAGEATGAGAAAPAAPAGGAGSGASAPADFVRAALPHAERAARLLGVSPLALVAQAALESGWGERMPRRADGTSSFNVFGIKAGGAWAGGRAAARTIEFEAGVPALRTEDFRAYADLGAAFDDYARLIGTDPRYADARRAAADPGRYLSALQAAGYATDPGYADKVGRVLDRVMAEVGDA
jgi:flagellar protein FlgJ